MCQLCQCMNLPGHPHFQAALHLLHHFRCHPPEPAIACGGMSAAPVARLPQQAPTFELSTFSPMFVIFADSAHADAEQWHSTACGAQVLQEGWIGHISWVPNPALQPAAESKNNCCLAAAMQAAWATKALAKLWFDAEEATHTIPI